MKYAGILLACACAAAFIVWVVMVTTQALAPLGRLMVGS